jgi:serine/threonine-protein kinase
VLAGRFRIERLLGAGGMGSVFAVDDLQSGHQVALKLMLPQFVASQEFSGRFVREARAAASLSSRHAARVHEVGQLPDGGLFMVMEILHGHDLSRVLSQRGPLPVAEAVGHVLEACDAIAEAHARGFVHRDLKPGNLFLAEQPGQRPIVKVLDFGISKSTKLDAGEGHTLTATDSSLGSPQYMSPEQVRSAKNVDHRTDIWSLGVILHKLVTGTLAFEGDSVGAHLAMIVSDPPIPLRRRRPDAPAELEQVVLRCLQKDLSLRYQNVAQLALALAPFAPPAVRPLVDRIVATTGPAAAYLPLPPLRDAPGEAPTVPGWGPAQAALPVPTAPRPSGAAFRVAVTAVVVALALLGAVVALVLRAPAAGSAPAPTVAAAPPPSAPVETAPPAPAAPAASVRITVEIEPATAAIELDGAPVEGRSVLIPRDDTAHKLVARAPGYAPETREVSARENAAIAIVLHRVDAGAPRGPIRKRKVSLETDL